MYYWILYTYSNILITRVNILFTCLNFKKERIRTISCTNSHDKKISGGVKKEDIPMTMVTFCTKKEEFH
jgi:hypothetical protein